MKPVSVVIPALGDVPLLRRAMKPLLLEFELRDHGDELIVVDDTGTGELTEHHQALFEHHDHVRILTRETNGGFARALATGVEAAHHDLVFSMNSDVIVRRGFLEPLVAACDQADVFAAAPAVWLNGRSDAVESFTAVELRGGLLDVRTPRPTPPKSGVHPIPFAVGGTMLFDRARFAALDGFDPMFEPFYFEDVDLCWRAWRSGLRTLYVAGSVVEHHHKGTIGKLLSESRRRAAVERGELLFNWKHLDDADLADHLALLFRRTLDGYLTDRREELIWISLALGKLEEAAGGRDAHAKHSSKAVVERLFRIGQELG